VPQVFVVGGFGVFNGFNGGQMKDLYFYDLDLEMWMQMDPGDQNLCLFHPSFSFIFLGKARSPPLEWSPIRGPTLVGSTKMHLHKKFENYRE